MRTLIPCAVAGLICLAGPARAEPPAMLPDELPRPKTVPANELPAPGSHLDAAVPVSGCYSCSTSIGFACGFSLGGGEVYGGAEYLLWWTKDDKAPPLLISNPQGLGLDSPATVILLGGTADGFDSDPHHGYRAWIGTRSGFGAVEFNWFHLDHASDFRSFGSDGSPGSVPLAIPIFVENVGESAIPLAFPGGFAGAFAAHHSTEMWGAELNYAFQFFDSYSYRYELVTGFRLVSMDEGLHIDTAIANLAGDRLHAADIFRTNNRFYGWQFGLRGESRVGRLCFAARGTIALGGTHREVEVDGGRAFTSAGVTTISPIGLLAQASNTGKTSSTQFDIVPEVNVKFGYDVTPNVTLTIGYTFLYWGNVFRPGSQIDRVFDTDRPTRLAPDRDFWAQGLNFGVEMRW